MKKTVCIILTFLLMIHMVFVKAVEIGDLERLTLEGTYIFTITLDDFSGIKSKIARYASDVYVSDELAEYSFKGEIKQDNGKYRFYVNDEEVFGAQLASSRDDLFVFFIKHNLEIEGPPLIYDIKAELFFDQSTQSFDNLVPGLATLSLVQSDGHVSIGWGNLEIIKIECQKEDTVIQTPKPEPDVEIIEQGLDALMTFVKGRVAVTTPEGKVMRASKNMTLIPGTTIKTDPDAQCEIIFTDNKVVKIMQRSVYTLPADIVKEKKTILQSGSAFFSRIKEAFTQDYYYVETPTAVMGIRGTEFYVEIDETTSDTLLLVKEGLVNITDKAGNEALISAGMKAKASLMNDLVTAYYSDDEAEIFDIEEQDDKVSAVTYAYLFILLAVIVVFVIIVKKFKKKTKHPRYRK